MTPTRIFIIDSLCAFLSAFFLGVVLLHFQEYIGMPGNVLIFLSLLACVFGLYSISCHFWGQLKWRLLLQIIAVTNTLYCVLTIGLIIHFSQSLTLLGYIYFVGEIAAILYLVFIEFKLVTHTP